MKDVRIVELADKRLGVFSRKRTKEEVYFGFSIVPSLDLLSMDAIQSAKPLDIIRPGHWGGVNQAYLLQTGHVGCIAHYSYHDTNSTGAAVTVYTNYAFVIDPLTREIFACKFIGSKCCYPPCPFKIPALEDCVFSSGISPREDGKWDLYSGVGDVGQGRITIDYPFEGYGSIVSNHDDDRDETTHRATMRVLL
ncbi:hypothetical protein STCU_03058 [Strigomonas culicis]|nr:hypothetical protein STCU_03058 [Strigomonas culicis]|eukprot:EPY31965.1 hypothetical protein STCU_03058 [Strigomonas culicis]